MKIKQLYDKETNDSIFPITKLGAIEDEGGTKLEELLNNKQDTLQSGVNISTINGNDITKGGNIEIKSAEPAPSPAVSSVNGKTGEVTITAKELGALTEIPAEYAKKSELPANTSDLTNNSDFTTNAALTAAQEDITKKLSAKQDTLTSENLKTINGVSLIGKGNVDVMPVIASGLFAEKPVEGIKAGHPYFCTDRQTVEGQSDGIMIYLKSDGSWGDALGRPVV